MHQLAFVGVLPTPFLSATVDLMLADSVRVALAVLSATVNRSAIERS